MRSKQWFKSLFVFGSLVLFAAACIQQAQRSPVTLTSFETPDPVAARVSDKTFRAFSHNISEHQQFACNTCHQRESRGVKSQLGGHESCIGCHMNEWIAEEQAICFVCHTDLNSEDKPVKAFPAKFIEGFNMKFDHAVHQKGEALPSDGCVSCHKPSGRGKTIPIGFQAHESCYGCHTSESKLGQCSVCHELKPYNRTTQSEYNFGTVSFTHQAHAQSSCTSCHRVLGKGLPNSQQVENIRIKEHGVPVGFNCRQCHNHNGGRGFDGNGPPGPVCARCHAGMTYTSLPSDTLIPDEAPAEE